ncbi:hypothetical protein Rhe02_59740 [Rhizocola hellebori]|uniref:Uncharacterized protein n=1 Tax=Rhizocola hellebori TaxID=1392758 RepID=A0A8J3QD86_9ACTN|nr:hypothetical protein Rhe02_59740 [Rhizocola hellebori]
MLPGEAGEIGGPAAVFVKVGQHGPVPGADALSALLGHPLVKRLLHGEKETAAEDAQVGIGLLPRTASHVVHLTAIVTVFDSH